jgi:Macrocin-O-methyltransferase (TylF)
MRQGTKRAELVKLFRESPVTPNDDLLTNLYLYQPATILAKTLYLNELYERIMHLPGDIFEFGVWWGANLSLFANLRTIHEPYNRARRVVGFDTFTGYPEPSEHDRPEFVQSRGYDVGADYRSHLTAVLDAHEGEGPSPTTRKYELIAGTIEDTLAAYLESNPQIFIALAYVDLQTYEGTKAALSGIKDRMVPGGVIAMDELLAADYAGEAQAFREVFADRRYRMERSRFLPDRTLVTVA